MYSCKSGNFILFYVSYFWSIRICWGLTTLGLPLNLCVYHETQILIQSLLYIMHTCMDQNTIPLSLAITTVTTFHAAFVVAQYSPAFWWFLENPLATMTGVCSTTGTLSRVIILLALLRIYMFRRASWSLVCWTTWWKRKNVLPCESSVWIIGLSTIGGLQIPDMCCLYEIKIYYFNSNF